MSASLNLLINVSFFSHKHRRMAINIMASIHKIRIRTHAGMSSSCVIHSKSNTVNSKQINDGLAEKHEVILLNPSDI